MIRTQVYLTDHEKASLEQFSATKGKTQNELIREAIDQFVAQNSSTGRKAILADAAGMWKDRHNLPDFDALRRQWDRDLPI